VEQSLGLICGAGVLPARMAAVARRQGWRVVAFTFGEAPDLTPHADRVVPSRLHEAEAVLAVLREERVGAVLFSGKFWMQDFLRGERPDAALAAVMERAGAMIDTKLLEVVIATLGSLGITLLDQRPFIGDWLDGAGCWSARRPTDAEAEDVRRGFAVARLAADLRVGQTVVVRRGAVTAVEALEGTTEAIRRGLALGGPGAVVVKAVARDHDYRFDTPTVGPETLEAAVAGGAAVVAVEAGRVLILEPEATARLADGAGIALVSVAAE
jgi:hypothetical protein